MQTLSIVDAAREFARPEEDIRKIVEDHNLAITRDTDGNALTVSREALERVLMAIDLKQAQAQASLEERIGKLEKAIAEISKSKSYRWYIALGVSALAGIGAIAAAVVAYNALDDVKIALRYQVMNDVADAMDAAQRAEDAHRADAVRHLDTRIGLVYDLRRDDGIEDPAWDAFLADYCEPLAETDYLGRADLFSDTKAMCDEEASRWKTETGTVPPS